MANIKVDKPWGYEIVLTDPNLAYTAKLLKVNSGQQLSLQYHDQKTETLTLVSGQATILTGPDKTNLSNQSMIPNTGYTITPNTLHRIIATTDTLIFEASTPERGTTFRVEDQYNRPNETEHVRKLHQNT